MRLESILSNPRHCLPFTVGIGPGRRPHLAVTALLLNFESMLDQPQLVLVLGVECQLYVVLSIRLPVKWCCGHGPLLGVLALGQLVLSREELVQVLLTNTHLLVELFDDEGVVKQVFVALPLHFIVLEALGEEEDALEGEYFLASVAEVVAADFDLVFELWSVFGVEGSLSVQQLEQDDADRPDVCFVRVVRFLNDLRSHVEWRAANGLVDLVQPLQFF